MTTDGRFNPLFDADVAETFEADTVILAIGQTTDLSFLKASDGIAVTPAGFIGVDPATLATSVPGVFAGGDAAFGPRNIIDAVANGKRAALSIHAHLTGTASQTYHELTIEKIPTRRYTRPEAFEQLPREVPPTIDLNRRTGISEVEETYTEDVARRQAERCLACHIQTIYNADLCVLCNRCVDVCPEFCLRLVALDALELNEAERSGLTGHFSLDPAGEASVMLKDDATCIRCGLCALRCPTDAMTMELFSYEERER